MRVQRAPRAADQPQRRPLLVGVAPVPGFSAHVKLDLTDLLRRLNESQVVGEVVARLVEACRRELLIDDDSVLRVVRLTEEGLLGTQLGAAVAQSAYRISSGLLSASPDVPAPTSRTLTVVHLGGTRVRALGDWGWGGLGVVTLGRAVPTLVPSEEHGLSITQRSVVRLGLTVADPARAHAAVQALDSVACDY